MSASFSVLAAFALGLGCGDKDLLGPDGSGAPDARVPPVDAGSDDGPEPPSCAIQHSTLLDGYPTRPTWEVAGVDYCVGHPATLTLADPSSISLSGFLVDAGDRVVLVNGGDVTLDGYDLTLGGGWSVMTTPTPTSSVGTAAMAARSSSVTT